MFIYIPRYIPQSLDKRINYPACSAFHHVTKQLKSAAGVDKLAVIFPVYIWAFYALHRH